MATPAFAILRRFDRIPVNIPVTLVADLEGKEVNYPAYMIDVSERGLRLKSNVSLSPGEIVEVVPAEGRRFAVRARVVWAGQPRTNLESDLGLEFLPPFPATSWGASEGTGQSSR